MLLKMKSWVHSCIHKGKYTHQKLYNVNSKFINKDSPLNSMIHQASKTTNLLVLFLYIILYPHSLHLIGFYFIFCVTVSINIYHWLLLWGLYVLLSIHCQSPLSIEKLLTALPNRLQPVKHIKIFNRITAYHIQQYVRSIIHCNQVGFLLGIQG